MPAVPGDTVRRQPRGSIGHNMGSRLASRMAASRNRPSNVKWCASCAAAAWAALRIKALAPLLALPATLRRLTDSDAFEKESDKHHG